MKNWTIAKRIVIGFTTVILITGALGVFTFTRLKAIKESFARLNTDCLPGRHILGEIEELARQHYALTLKHVLAQTVPERAQLIANLQTNIGRIDELTNTYQSTAGTEQDRELLGTLVAARAPYVAAFKEVVRLSDHQKTSEAHSFLKANMDPAYHEFMQVLHAKMALKRTSGEGLAREIDTAVYSTEVGILVGLGLALLAAAGVSVVIIRGTSRVLHRVSGALEAGSNQLALAAEQVSITSQSLASGASEQAAALEESSSSLEEISSMTKESAQKAQTAKEIAGQARSAADGGATDMREMSTAMAEIKASSDEVGKIIKTIDEIAFQTNILALNAAVEAARAGEAGMGFAVVADEVRNLAQRSAQAARETAARIEDSIRKSERGVQISDKVGASLQSIVTRARQVDELIAEIALACQEQSQGLGQVNIAVAQMDEVTQRNASSAEETARASEELNAQAAILRNAVGELLKLATAETKTTSAGSLDGSDDTVLTNGHAMPSAAFANGSAARPLAARPLAARPSKRALPMPEDEDATVESSVRSGFTDF